MLINRPTSKSFDLVTIGAKMYFTIKATVIMLYNNSIIHLVTALTVTTFDLRKKKRKHP